MNSLETAKYWSENKFFDKKTQLETKKVLNRKNNIELDELFGSFLEFGTGGLRGLMGVGTNRINCYTIQIASEALARTIKIKTNSDKKNSVIIGYDSRNKSFDFAKQTCEVFLAHDIPVYLFRNISPTPLVSFEILRRKSICGVMITASHNPPEYNGYKVFWDNGGQIVPPIDKQIINEIKKVIISYDIRKIPFSELKNKNIFSWIDFEADQNYLNSVRTLSLGKREYNKNFGIVFSPLHGTGGRLVPKLLELQGFSKVKVVEEQMKPDGNFSTLISPNPEDISSYEMSIKISSNKDELILVNDPDADRIGVMVRDSNNSFQFFSGNKIGVLLLDYILSAYKEKNLLTKKDAVITTFVTSPLIKKIAKEYNIEVIEVLTGFKWIRQAALHFEKKSGGKFIFAMEESHGYLMGNHSGDKDGVWAAMAFAEMNAELKHFDITPIEKLNKIFKKHGTYLDKLETQTVTGRNSMNKISKIISSLRNSPPSKLGGEPVLKITDLLNNRITWTEKKVVTPGPDLPSSNVISFELKNGSSVIVRPSGTEPKIKYYFNLCGDNIDSLKKKFLEIRASIIKNF